METSAIHRFAHPVIRLHGGVHCNRANKVQMVLQKIRIGLITGRRANGNDQ